MKLSNYPLRTLKDAPSDAELISHQLMLRSGLIKKLASGIFTWMPFGLKVLRKIEQTVRNEMDDSGALEVLMPTIQPSELWQETQRWDRSCRWILLYRGDSAIDQRGGERTSG